MYIVRYFSYREIFFFLKAIKQKKTHTQTRNQENQTRLQYNVQLKAIKKINALHRSKVVQQVPPQISKNFMHEYT